MAGLSEDLRVGIFGQYELFVRSAPWKRRHPATLALKKICASLMVNLIIFLIFLLHLRTLLRLNKYSRRVDVLVSKNQILMQD